MTLFCILLLCAALAACNESSGTASSPTAPEQALADTPVQTVTETPFQPSPTPEALKALVNAEPISVEAFQAELARYSAASATQPGPEEEQLVLDSMINQLLLAQAAVEQGFSLDQQALDDRIDALAEDLGSMQALDDWLAANGYTGESFRSDLERSVLAAWMRDQVIAAVPSTADQVHARQILSTTPEEAEQVYAQLQAGTDFARLANQADPLTGGELGWFPRGYLFYPELEDAVFQLQPGEYTGIIQTPVGHHILLVLERDPERELAPDAFLQAQRRALESWLAQRRQQSEITFP